MDYTSILEQHQALVNAIEQSMAQQAAEQARKQAEFQSLKNSVDKVFFAYTLQRASDEKLTEWTQYLSSGVSVDLVASIMRSDNSSMYFGAGREASINNAFTTLFGRSPTAGEAARYSSVDTALIPGLVALEATGSDAETMYLRLHGAQAIKDYYQATNIPLTYGMPAMKAKEQLLTLKAGDNAQSLVNDAVREMGDFLAEWGRVINKPGNSVSDVESPKSKYFWTDNPNVGVAFYEPPTTGSNGKILFLFVEPVDWSAIDKNRDGQIQIFSELNMVLDNPRLLGDNPKIVTDLGVSSLVIEIGSNASPPSSGSMDMITFVGISDYAGNVGGVTFGLDFASDRVAPEADSEVSGDALLVGDSLTLRFDQIVDWGKVDTNHDGVISIGAFNSSAAELQYAIQGNDPTEMAGALEVDSFSLNQLTLNLNLPDVNFLTGGRVLITGIVDLAGNTINAVFDF